MLDLNNITMLGGTGFIGSRLVFELSKFSNNITILTRSREKNKKLLVIPNIKIVEADINDDIALREYTKDSDLVINTVGILNELDSINSFENLHVNLVKKISNVIKYHKIKRMIHIGSLNSMNSNTSNYMKSKAEAEKYLLEITSNFCNVTIVKPSVVFGENDTFFNRFAKILKYSPIFPLACPYSKFAPIYVGDLTKIIIESINAKKTYNQAIDITGPKIYTFHELIKLTLEFMKIKRFVIPLPDFLSRIQAYIFERLPGKIFTIDNYHSLQVDSVSDTGIKGTTFIEQVVPTYLNSSLSETEINEWRKRSGR
ncbi:MAG: complex I NDUFA9 subunit family protein [Pseudomonadota bacterium]|nr:complex I NDUFA9 subunit family protein [Pseudomonadota bacterium]